MPSDTIGERIRHARLAAGLTQRALAESSGIRQNTIWRVEAGKVKPLQDTVAVLACAIGIPWQDLYGDGPREGLPEISSP